MAYGPMSSKEEIEARLSGLERSEASGDGISDEELNFHNSYGLDCDSGSRRLGIILQGSIGRNLKALFLYRSGLTGAYARNIFEALNSQSLPLLEQLGIGHNSIGDEGAKCIAEFIENSTSIRMLSMQNMALGVAGAQRLARALALNRSLTKVILGSEGDLPAAALLQAFVPSEEAVGLPDSVIGAWNHSDTDLFVWLCCGAQVGDVLHQIVLKNKVIVELTFEGCAIPWQQWQKIFQALRQNDTLKKLSLIRINVPERYWEFENRGTHTPEEIALTTELAGALLVSTSLETLDTHETPWDEWHTLEGNAYERIRRMRPRYFGRGGRN